MSSSIVALAAAAPATAELNYFKFNPFYICFVPAAATALGGTSIVN